MGMAPYDSIVTPKSGHAAKLLAKDHINLHASSQLGHWKFSNTAIGLDTALPWPWRLNPNYSRSLDSNAVSGEGTLARCRGLHHLIGFLLALVLLLPMYELFPSVGLSEMMLNLHSLSYCITTRDHPLSNPEAPKDHDSSGTAYSSRSAYSESREIEYIDSMIPSTIYDPKSSEARWTQIVNQPAWLVLFESATGI